MKSCNNYKYAIFQDYGYSNYTVEGTEFACAKKHHPDAPFDRWYGGDIRLRFAKTCPCFSKGEPIELDVEGEGFATLSDEQKRIYMEWNV